MVSLVHGARGLLDKYVRHLMSEDRLRETVCRDIVAQQLHGDLVEHVRCQRLDA